MERVTLCAVGAVVLLLGSLIPVLCDCNSQDVWEIQDWSDCEASSWPNQGGGLRNRREAKNEHKISHSTVTSLALKWTAPTHYDVSSTPSIDGRRGAVYFSSWDGFIYAVKKDTGALIWKVNLTVIAAPIPGLLEAIVVLPYLKQFGGGSPPDLANLLCRATPTIAGPLVIFGLYNPCYVLALNSSTGAVVWWTSLDSHPFCVFTQSGTYYKGSFYIGTSSQEEVAPLQTCCTFQGAFFKLNAKTGQTMWKLPMVPYNQNTTGGYAGAAVWGSSPAIDVSRNLIYIATGNTYSVPPAVEACEASLNTTNGTHPDPCISLDDHSESFLAINMDTGKILWATHLGGYDVWTLICALAPVPVPNCPTTLGPDYDFGEAPMLLTIMGDNPRRLRDIVVAGQKSGVVHALDRQTGAVVWQTAAGPGGEGGGASWGMTTDGERVFTSIINTGRQNFTLVPSSTVITWGGWVGMNATTGKVLWSTANTVPFFTQTPVAHVNGVIFGGSAGNVTSGTPTGQIIALDAITGAILWNYTTDGGVTGGVSIMDGCIFQPVGVTIGTNAGPFIHGRSTISLCIP